MQIEFEVFGDNALFTDPVSKLGGEKFSYHIPTYEAMLGVLKNIYWKPTFVWVIDRIRVMNPIQTHTRSILIPYYGDGETKSDRFFHTYLSNVKYQVSAHIEWNPYLQKYSNDQNWAKHFCIAQKWLDKGGKRNICLGTADCVAYVERCDFGSGVGHYDNIDQMAFGNMFHGFDYPNELLNNFPINSTGNEGKLFARFHNPVMKNGIIRFEKHSDVFPPEAGRKGSYVRKLIKNQAPKLFT